MELIWNALSRLCEQMKNAQSKPSGSGATSGVYLPRPSSSTKMTPESKTSKGRAVELPTMDPVSKPKSSMRGVDKPKEHAGKVANATPEQRFRLANPTQTVGTNGRDPVEFKLYKEMVAIQQRLDLLRCVSVAAAAGLNIAPTYNVETRFVGTRADTKLRDTTEELPPPPNRPLTRPPTLL